MAHPHLTIALQGGCSVPLGDVAKWIQEALAKRKMNVTVEVPDEPDNVWQYGYDGLFADESVVIRQDQPSRLRQLGGK